MVQVGMLLSDVPRSVPPAPAVPGRAADRRRGRAERVLLHRDRAALPLRRPAVDAAGALARPARGARVAADEAGHAGHDRAAVPPGAPRRGDRDARRRHGGAARLRRRSRLPGRGVRLPRGAVRGAGIAARRDPRAAAAAVDRGRGHPPRPPLPARRGAPAHPAGPGTPPADLGRGVRQGRRPAGRAVRHRVRRAARGAAGRGGGALRDRARGPRRARAGVRAPAPAPQRAPGRLHRGRGRRVRARGQGSRYVTYAQRRASTCSTPSSSSGSSPRP